MEWRGRRDIAELALSQHDMHVPVVFLHQVRDCKGADEVGHQSPTQEPARPTVHRQHGEGLVAPGARPQINGGGKPADEATEAETQGVSRYTTRTTTQRTHQTIESINTTGKK
jgi:hypothetical protein